MVRIRQDAPEWSDLSPGDPGIVLVEVFAYLTETLIYRLNRVPDKLFIEFLRLIGVRLQPPAAAAVTLTFSREEGVLGPIEIPRGTQVTVARPVSGSEPPVFVTAEAATMSATADEATRPGLPRGVGRGRVPGQGDRRSRAGADRGAAADDRPDRRSRWT